MCCLNYGTAELHSWDPVPSFFDLLNPEIELVGFISPRWLWSVFLKVLCSPSELVALDIFKDMFL